MPHIQKRQKNSLNRTETFEELPILFGKGGRDKLLVCLAVNGPLRVQTLANAIGSHPSSVIEMIQHLEALGLVMTSRAPGYSYAAINQDLPIRQSLVAVLLALDQRYPAPRRSSQAPQSGEWKSNPQPILTEIFSSVPRSRVLLFVAARGPSEMAEARRELRCGTAQIRQTVTHWERQGVVKSICAHGRRVIQLNERFHAAKPLLALLDEVLVLAHLSEKSLRSCRSFNAITLASASA
ncbi:MAG: MarR family transcriptional regulator [Candidatus Cybelea sp.]